MTKAKLPRTAAPKASDTKIDLAAALCSKFPDAPNRTLSRRLCKDHPNAFPKIEMARDAVRYVRGARGQKARKKNTYKQLAKPLNWQRSIMPETLSKPRKPFVITGRQIVGIISDLHIPYHDPTAIAAALDFLEAKKIDTLVLNGDIADFYAISRHDKDPNRSFKDELDAVRQFLFYLRTRFPKVRIILKIGNHEDRYERMLRKDAPALLDIAHFSYRSFMHLDDLGIELVESKQLIRIGKLPLYHGHELPQGMSSPVNPARGLWMRVEETLAAGHWHRTSEHVNTSGLIKRVSSCFSIGCLCDLSPDYAIVNKWNHGFAYVDLREDGNYDFRNLKIIKGQVY